jgi:hypothetical protein
VFLCSCFFFSSVSFQRFSFRALDSNPWNCSDCNVQDLGNKSAYYNYKNIYGQDVIAYCSNNASLGDIDDAPSNFTCTERTTTTTTTTITTVKACIFDGVDFVNKTLITCDGVADTSIDLNSRGITSVNANAFENNTNLTEL